MRNLGICAGLPVGLLSLLLMGFGHQEERGSQGASLVGLKATFSQDRSQFLTALAFVDSKVVKDQEAPETADYVQEGLSTQPARVDVQGSDIEPVEWIEEEIQDEGEFTQEWLAE